MLLEIIDKNTFKIMTLPNTVTINLEFCSLCMICNMFFSPKIWFVRTSTRIVKSESRVVKSNPAQIAKNITPNYKVNKFLLITGFTHKYYNLWQLTIDTWFILFLTAPYLDITLLCSMPKLTWYSSKQLTFSLMTTKSI